MQHPDDATVAGHDVTVEVILPTRNMRDLTRLSVRRIAAQLRPGDHLSVYDDASDDGTTEALRDMGISVTRAVQPLGPYAGRHLLAERSHADVLVFADARSQALPGWLDAHRALFADGTAALSCTGTVVAEVPGLGARIFRASNMFEIDTKLDVPQRLAFYPSANLGVRRSAYQAVGGFRRMRSGGDADLCWRVQLAGLGDFAADRRVLMEWIPRTTLRAVIDQWRRYGRSSAYLEAVYEAELESGPRASTRRSVGSALAQSLRQMRRTPFATTAQFMLDALNMVVYLRAKRSSDQLARPTRFELPELSRNVAQADDQ